MPEWVTVEKPDLYDWCVQSVVDRLLSAGGIVGTRDPFYGIRSSVISAIRMRIATCKTNVIDCNEDTVPPEFKALACLRIIVALQGRISRSGDADSFSLTDDNKTLLRKLEEDLTAASQCKLAVTNPECETDESDIQRGSTAAAVLCRIRTFPSPKFDDGGEPGAFSDGFSTGFAIGTRGCC
jgi:hypothetical protein